MERDVYMIKKKHPLILLYSCFIFILLCSFFIPVSSFADDNAAVLKLSSKILVAGKFYHSDARKIDLSQLNDDNVEKTIEKLHRFPELKVVVLSPKDSQGQQSVSTLSFDSYKLLVDAFPEIRFQYCFPFFGQNVSTDLTRSLLFKKQADIDDSAIDKIKEIIPYLPQLKTISFHRCPATNEKLAEFREEFPEINVRWIVPFAGFSAWSDTEKIWAMAGLYHDEDCENLKYFQNLKYLDIGHNGITRCDFLYGMPNLEVLILAIGNLEDISPVSSLKKLEYLEICDTKVTDLSPLSDCASLAHLNIGGIPATDLSPLYSLKHLKRLFADNMTALSDTERNDYESKFRELYPRAEISFLMYPEGGVENGYWRFSRGPYTGSYVDRYKLLREQFGYDDDFGQAYVYD